MEGITLLVALLSVFAYSFYVSNEQAKKEANVEIVEQTQRIALPDLDSTQTVSISWWREIYEADMAYNQRYYLPSLSLAVGYRHIIVPYVGGYVKGFNLEDGRWEWSLSLPEQVSAGIYRQGNLGYVGGEDGLLMAFEHLSGKETWQIRLDSGISSLSFGKEVIYAYSRRGHIHAILPKSGEILWSYIGKEPVSNVYGSSEVKEVNQIAYVGSGNGNILALKSDTGELLWQRTIGQPTGFSDLENLVDIDSNFIVDDNTLYVSAFSQQLFAINPINQLNIWQKSVPAIYTLGQDNISSPLQDKEEHLLIVLTNNSELHAYHAQTGILKWQNKQARLRGLTPPLKYQDYWLSIDRMGTAFFFNRQNGKLMTYYSSQAGISMRPAIKGNHFYWLSKKGQLYAMKLQHRNQADVVIMPTR